MKHGLVFAMEADGEFDKASQVELVPETQAEVETASAEVAEQSGEIETMDTDVASAETDAGTLGDIQEVMAQSVESGEGLTEEAAAIAEVAVESIRARLGMKRGTKVIPALESFGSKSSRLHATKIAMETIGESIKKIWENIIKAIKWVWDKIKGFWLSLTKSRGSLLKHLEGMQKRVADMAAETLNEKTVKGSAAATFSINGKASFDTAKKVLADSQKLIPVTATASDIANGMVNKLTGDDPTAVMTAGADLLVAIKKAMAGLGEVKGNKGDRKMVHFYGNLAGGRSVSITSDKEGSAAAIGVQLEVTGKAAEEAETLNKAQMGELLTQAIAVVKELQSFDKVEKGLEKIAKACNDVAQTILKTVAVMGDKSDNGEGAKAQKAAAANIRTLNSMVAKFGSSIPSAVFQAAKGAGDYVNASIAAHGDKAKTEGKK